MEYPSYHLKKRLSVAEIESDYLNDVLDARFPGMVVLGGIPREAWYRLKAQMLPVDEIWTCRETVLGHEGFAIVRNGVVAAWHCTVL